MTEVDYGGEGHHTRLKDQLINLCVYGLPLSPIYKGVEEGEGRPSHGAPKGGVLLPVGGGLLLARPSWPAAPSPLLLYIRGQGGTP